jgi:cytochrome c551/c552
MKYGFSSVIFLLLFSVFPPLGAQNSGEKIFKTTCSACHTINKGRLVGPDLSGIYKKKESKWLIRFIQSSQRLVKAGDTAAVAIYNKFNRIPMPDNHLSDEEILGVIEYIKASEQKATVIAEGLTSPKDSLSLQYNYKTVPLGSALFNGYTRFAHGGSPCIVCHNINHQSILGGGTLSLNLTKAFTKLGPEGIKAILTNPPFPVMNKALLSHPLNEDEKHAIISMLKSVSEQNFDYQTADSGGFIFIFLSSICALLILVHIYILYDNGNIIK